jgi:ankyrin repeat protein
VIAPALLFFLCNELKLCLRVLIILLFFSQDTPLHLSAENGHLETCRLLLQSNANLNAYNDR